MSRPSVAPHRPLARPVAPQCQTLPCDRSRRSGRVYWERRLPAGTPLRASASLVVHTMAATVCRLEAGAPSRYDTPREKVARTHLQIYKPAVDAPAQVILKCIYYG